MTCPQVDWWLCLPGHARILSQHYPTLNPSPLPREREKGEWVKKN